MTRSSLVFRERFDSEVKWRYHGTRRTCRIGDNASSLEPCADRGCYLCSILRQSFGLDHSCKHGHRTAVHCFLANCSEASRSLFGRGIYSTSVSSSKRSPLSSGKGIRLSLHLLKLTLESLEADNFVRNHHVRSHNHVMLLCNIVGDNPQYLRHPDPTRFRPCGSHDCVSTCCLMTCFLVSRADISSYKG